MNILIVEDDLDLSERLADILAAAGHVTRVAHDGLEGLQDAASDPPDVILLDVEMPILDGPEMAKALAMQRAGQPSIPIVLMSGSLHLQRIAGSVGTRFFLRKPFGISQLVGLVSEALGVER